MKHSIIKIAKINKLIQRNLSIVLNKHFLNKKDNLITIIQVMISNDLSKAKIFISTIQNDDNIIYILNNSSKKIKYYLSAKIKLHKTPELLFINEKNLLDEYNIQNIINTI